MTVHASIRDQRPWEQVIFCENTGWPNNVEDVIRLAIDNIAATDGYHRKVGITNDPVRRWREAYRKHGWRQMYVLYTSTSHNHVCELEARMTDSFELGLMVSPGWYYNQRMGGGGPKPIAPPYYLYVVTAPRYARID